MLIGLKRLSNVRDIAHECTADVLPKVDVRTIHNLCKNNITHLDLDTP